MKLIPQPGQTERFTQRCQGAKILGDRPKKDSDSILWNMLNAIKEQNAQLSEQLERLQAQVVLQADSNQELSRKRALAKAKR